jgi:hypothetical protein
VGTKAGVKSREKMRINEGAVSEFTWVMHMILAYVPLLLDTWSQTHILNKATRVILFLSYQTLGLVQSYDTLDSTKTTPMLQAWMIVGSDRLFIAILVFGMITINSTHVGEECCDWFREEQQWSCLVYSCTVENNSFILTDRFIFYFYYKKNA